MYKRVNVRAIVDAFVKSEFDWIWLDYDKLGYANHNNCRMSFRAVIAQNDHKEVSVIERKNNVYLVYLPDGSEDLKPEYNKEFWDSVDNLYNIKAVAKDILDEFAKSTTVAVYRFDYKDYGYRDMHSCYGCIRIYIKQSNYTHLRTICHEDSVYVVNTNNAQTISDPYARFKKTE